MPLLNSKIVSQILPTVVNNSNKVDKNSVITIAHKLLKSPLKETPIKTNNSLTDRIPAYGLICAVLSVICWSLSSLIVKILTNLHSIQILVFRSIFQLVFYGTCIAIKKYPLFGVYGHRIDLVLRSLSGTVALSSIFMAYRMMPFSDASTIHFSSPVFVTVFAYFILKEKVSILQVITGVLTLIGVTIISKPQFLFGSESQVIHMYRLEGIGLSVLASVSAAFAIINLRKLKTTPAAVVVFWFAFSIIICGSIGLVILNQFVVPTNLWSWTLLIAIGFLGIGDQYFLTKSLQYESAGPVSVARTFNIVLSFIWEATILAEPIEWTSVTGAVIISTCVVALAIVKWQTEKPEFFEKIYNSMICCSKHSAKDFHDVDQLKTYPQSLRSSTNSLNVIALNNCSAGGPEIVSAARSQYGVPYSWGGGSWKGKSTGTGIGAHTIGFDCSGLTQYAVYKGTGKIIARTVATQYTDIKCKRVAYGSKQLGDLIFYGNPPYNVGIVSDSNTFINASKTGDVVKEQTIYSTNRQPYVQRCF
ncbi:solute carrier family 35 member G1-like [Oppia nitens]|uniref:solute carrier family 35 member G1-like n=1 Tax=Oppia nitens TaxID=1686743 RepID=UPI0023DAB246|nr:solute carrier family 35 member G1-like [Oppia nitens]